MLPISSAVLLKITSAPQDDVTLLFKNHACAAHYMNPMLCSGTDDTASPEFIAELPTKKIYSLYL